MQISCALGKVGLVPFVQARDECGHEEGNSCPLDPPTYAGKGEGGAPSPKKKYTQHEITHKMAALTDKSMPDRKVLRTQAKQEMQHGVQKSAGVFSRSQVGGLGDDKCEPKSRRDPGLQQLFLG